MKNRKLIKQMKTEIRVTKLDRMTKQKEMTGRRKRMKIIRYKEKRTEKWKRKRTSNEK